MGICIKCNKQIKPTDIKLCNKCSNAYHYQCLGVSLEAFGKESKAYKASWKCPNCKADRRGESSSSTPSQAVAFSPGNDSLSPNNIEELKLYLDRKLDDTLSHLLREIRRDVSTENNNTRSSIQELNDSVKFMSAKFDKLQSDLATATEVIKRQETEVSALRSEVTELKSRLNQFEQQSRDCNLEVQCVPEYKTENLKTVVQQLFTAVGCDLSSHELVNFHRVAKKNQESSRPRSIVVKLASPLVRDSVLAAVKTFNKTHQKDKLNTGHLGLAGDKKPVYVCEHLSPDNKLLHAAARKVAKDKQYEFVWVRGGKIYIRKDANSKGFVVRDFNFLNSL